MSLLSISSEYKMEQENKAVFNSTYTEIDDNPVNEFPLNSSTSIIFYSFRLLMFFATIYVNILVLRMSKREDLLIASELQMVSMIYIWAAFLSLIYHGIVEFAFPASIAIGDWFCSLSNVFMSAVMFQQMILTFTITLNRYVFTVYREKTTKTEKRQKQFIWAISVMKIIVIIILTAKFVIFDDENQYVKYWNSVCNGNMTVDKGQKHILDEMQTYRHTKDTHALISLFGNIENPTLKYPLQAFCIAADLIFILTSLNSTKGYLQYKISRFMKR